MQSFIIRDNNGISKGKLTGYLAASLMSKIDGHWRAYNVPDDADSCFVVDADCVYTVGDIHGSLQIYLWSGDILVPE